MAVLPNIDQIQSSLSKASEVLILTHENPTIDSLGASLALYLSISQIGKNVTIACPTESTVEFSNLVGVDKVSQILNGKNFIISLDYVEGSIEKVSYNINNGKFNLVIEPKPGAPTFSPEKVHYSSGNANADLIILLDCPNLQSLGKFYQGEEDLYTKATTLNIDYHPENLQYGKINLVEPNFSSTSEIVSLLIDQLGLPFNEDSATNLLAGIEFTTQSFSPNLASMEAFEAAAICLKNGGKRKIATSNPKASSAAEAPLDWLQPKIFKSSSPQQPINPKGGESTTL